VIPIGCTILLRVIKLSFNTTTQECSDKSKDDNSLEKCRKGISVFLKIIPKATSISTNYIQLHPFILSALEVMGFTRKNQKGGFYPSVFEGVRNAGLLVPLVLRQAYRLWGTKKTKKTKSKGKGKGSKGNKGRGHLLKD